MVYFRLVSVILGVLILTSILGIAYLLAQRGFYPRVTICLPDNSYPDLTCTFVKNPNGETYFSIQCLAGTLMLMIYLMPMAMRPVDFIMNFSKYIVGFISYIAMIAAFTNLF
jgi:hypothetical protein